MDIAFQRFEFGILTVTILETEVMKSAEELNLILAVSLVNTVSMVVCANSCVY